MTFELIGDERFFLSTFRLTCARNDGLPYTESCFAYKPPTLDYELAVKQLTQKRVGSQENLGSTKQKPRWLSRAGFGEKYCVGLAKRRRNPFQVLGKRGILLL